MLELVDDNKDYEQDDFDMNSLNHPSPPYYDTPVSPDCNTPPLSPQPKGFGSSAPRVPPKITCIFHPTINGMLSLVKFIKYS